MIIKLDTTNFKRRLWHRAFERHPNSSKDPIDKIKQSIFYGMF
ncbi:hypothetical protein M2139_000301 [Enterococcus sp. PF1-24]|nr:MULTISPECIES: hypothetical protein [unclassified Enterococcus]MDH6363279.1 hypothetical protein [Enterococcus sp. PFB1-1]MDH6400420.1 hypothetical protein [Enterococcus sp. PF1-24]